jgi:hypothetical protein
MHRAGWIAAAIVGWTVCATTRSFAQVRRLKAGWFFNRRIPYAARPLVRHWSDCAGSAHRRNARALNTTCTSRANRSLVVRC